MKICQTSRIDLEKGDYCLLNEFHGEGLHLEGQYKTLEETIGHMGVGSSQVIVKLVDFDVTEQ